MNVINRRTIETYSKQFPHAASWLRQWFDRASRSQWTSLQELRLIHPAADQVGGCLIFNAAGGYRLIVGVRWAAESRGGTFYVKHFLSHADYDRNSWQKDC